MTDRDQLSERVARAIRKWYWPDDDGPLDIEAGWEAVADAVLAVLPEYEQVDDNSGTMDGDN